MQSPPVSSLVASVAMLRRLNGHALAAAWLGHASVFLRIAGLNVLVDPVFSDRIGVSLGPITIGLARLTPAPVAPGDLPPLDLVLISHAHFDHLDKPTLRQLASGRTTVITARDTGGLIPRGFREVVELDWGRSLRVGGVEVAAMQPRHWGRRLGLGRRRGYNSYVLRSGEQGVLVVGDSAFTTAFNGLGELDLAVMGIGAYDPWIHAHATPEQTWAMFRASGARRLLPVHHSTFPLGDEPPGEPLRRLLAAAGSQAHCILALPPGVLWSSHAEKGIRDR